MHSLSIGSQANFTPQYGGTGALAVFIGRREIYKA